MDQEKINMFINKHNTSISMVLIAIFGGIISYGLINYYYSAVSNAPSPYTAFIPAPANTTVNTVPIATKIAIPDKRNILNFDVSNNALVYSAEILENSQVNTDIYVFNTANNQEKRITSDTSSQSNAAISGESIVWFDAGIYPNGLYYMNRFASPTSTPEKIDTMTTNYYNSPSISGSNIVWQDYRHNTFDIYLYNTNTKTTKAITNDYATQEEPFISGQKIVWREKAYMSSNNNDIYLYDLNNNTKTQITTNKADQRSPRISGINIVWADNRNEFETSDIYLSTSTDREIPIVIAPKGQYEPDIYGNRIAWTDYRNGRADIYMYDLTTKKETQITSDPAFQDMPKIEGNKIYWRDYRSGKAEIWMTEIPQPPAQDTTPPSVPAGLQATYSNNQVKISWNHSTDNVKTAGYNLYKSETNVASDFKWLWYLIDDVNTTPSISDSKITAGKTYYYKADAYDTATPANVSAKSAAVSITVPGQSLNLTATALSSTQVKLNWTSYPDTSTYQIYKNNAWLWWTPANTLTITDSKCKSGTTYTYRIDAHDATSKLLKQSNTVSVTTP